MVTPSSESSGPANAICSALRPELLAQCQRIGLVDTKETKQQLVLLDSWFVCHLRHLPLSHIGIYLSDSSFPDSQCGTESEMRGWPRPACEAHENDMVTAACRDTRLRAMRVWPLFRWGVGSHTRFA